MSTNYDVAEVFGRYTSHQDVSDVDLRPKDWLILPVEGEEMVCYEAQDHTTIAPNQPNSTVTRCKLVLSTNIHHQIGDVRDIVREKFGVPIMGTVVRYEDRQTKIDPITAQGMIPFEIVKLIGSKHAGKNRVSFSEAHAHLQTIQLFNKCEVGSKEYLEQKSMISYALKHAKNTLKSHGSWIRLQVGVVHRPAHSQLDAPQTSSQEVKVVDYERLCMGMYMLLTSGIFGNVVVKNMPEK